LSLLAGMKSENKASEDFKKKPDDAFGSGLILTFSP
jgi:hypothetical protein